MKKLFKLGFYVIIGFIGLGILMNMVGDDETTQKGEPDKVVEADAKPKAEPKKESDPVTKENFEKIVQGDSLTGKGGMTIEEVLAILGEPSQKMESQSGDTKMEDYSWIGKDFQTISVNFTNGKVSFKMFME
jgi:flagellar motor protein MotB